MIMKKILIFRFQIIIWWSLDRIVSKVGDHSQGLPEGSLFHSYYTEVCVCVGGGATPFPGLLHFTLDTNLYNAEC